MKDISEQYEISKKLFSKVKARSVGIILLNEVIAEVVYVLTKVYKLPGEECVEILQILVENTDITFRNSDRQVINDALKLYAKHTIDIVDAILYSYAKLTNAEVFSFHNDFRKMDS